MNAYATAQKLGLTGKPAEIVATLQNSGLTARKISLSYLTDLLRTRGMLTKLPYEDPDTGMKWTGSVITMIVELRRMKHPALSEVNRWFGHITDPRSENFDTTLLEFSVPFWTLSQAIGGEDKMPSLQDFAAIAALGGGWLFANLTVEQYVQQETEARDAETAAQLHGKRDNWKERFDAALNKIGTSETAKGIADIIVITQEMAQ